MQILISSKPSSTSSLVSAMPSMPPTLIAWRTSTASNQPQRRGRPVTVPNSRPRSPRRLADLVGQLGRERAAADPRRIGLGDAEHDSRPRAGAIPDPAAAWPATRVRRGDVGIGAVVDVEHRALRALEQDALAGAARLVEQPPDRRRHRAGSCGAISRSAASSSARSTSGAPRPRSSALWCSSSSSTFGLRAPAGRRGRRPGWRGGRPCPHRPGRCRARWCRSCSSPRRSSRARSSSPCDGRIRAALSASLQSCRA